MNGLLKGIVGVLLLMFKVFFVSPCFTGVLFFPYHCQMVSFNQCRCWWVPSLSAIRYFVVCCVVLVSAAISHFLFSLCSHSLSTAATYGRETCGLRFVLALVTFKNLSAIHGFFRADLFVDGYIQ